MLITSVGDSGTEGFREAIAIHSRGRASPAGERMLLSAAGGDCHARHGPHLAKRARLGRCLSTQIGNALGQPIVIENRPGVNGIVGTNLAYVSRPMDKTVPFAADEVIH
jgi:hypothetical protein